MKSHEVIRLQIPGALEYIALARSAVDVVGEQLHLPGAARAEVKLAVGEACNNAVLYAKRTGDSPAGPVIVACRIGQDALEIDITNQGNGFHPGVHAEMPSPEMLAEHGRGRALMEMLMDSVEYISDNGNTTVRLRKMRPLPN